MCVIHSPATCDAMHLYTTSTDLHRAPELQGVLFYNRASCIKVLTFVCFPLFYELQKMSAAENATAQKAAQQRKC
jgi:hypothetical protein